MDYEDVYYVERNAPIVRDRRVRVPARATTLVPAAPPAAAPAATLASVGPYQYPYPYPQPGFVAQTVPQGWGYPVNPPYAVPMPANNLASILGGFGDIGTLANIVAQVFAAFLPLPAAPTPQDDSENNQASQAMINSANLIRYQNALALFAKRDQQVLTLGSVLKELFKRPNVVMG
jgi:hypothetical protein